MASATKSNEKLVNQKLFTLSWMPFMYYKVICKKEGYQQKAVCKLNRPDCTPHCIIDVGQRINVGPGKFGKNNNHIE